ncbi:hypothetical protein JAAARDRAFT_576577 [Jaapia argillacea MUCL 33604]|uniref:C2 domain-containing protein n=1 Tax=Jaapia argillacea MUCL 33604 TaxID=933084 RepID=A0A067Q2P8_9AGAM|nr:hypothetical protein JAAARDRAFT_576577 [Jaapia argillacea MUCL 33604]
MTRLTVRGPDRGLNERKFLLITHTQIQGIPELPRTFVEAKAGGDVHRTKIFKDKTNSPWWDEEILLHLNDRESSAVKFSFSLYHGRSWLWKQFLGRVEGPLHEILAGNSGECLIQMKINSPQVSTELTSTVLLRYRTDLHSAAQGLIEDTAQPTEHTIPLLNAVSTVQPLAGVVQETLNKAIPILETIEPLKQLFDEIAKFHPFASAAWSLLSAGYNARLASIMSDDSSTHSRL